MTAERAYEARQHLQAMKDWLLRLEIQKIGADLCGRTPRDEGLEDRIRSVRAAIEELTS